ncbi:alpha-2-macroglobulin family protein [Alkalicaulis satelles]|uniref:Alpha-2-macroglobulin family protein n=1 Tax=Alkalicaulis satelles TaxID=2609175 RepID=A0A5M6ZAK2_9PROT|nr:alpha-2-macroglobulin [Alkalicaulis satelles]KAA5800954.1 alpha-2-macroglobulin family protein [Alkalicaulis satelles]
MIARSLLRLSGLMMLAGALAACDPGGGADAPAPQGPLLTPRAADAPRAAEEAPDRFEYLRYAINLESPAPELCLTFSAPLDPDVDYSAYIAIDEPVSLAVDGQRLCVGGLQFGQTRTVTLREGLPSADGQRLAADEEAVLNFDDRPAFIGFAGDGIILPRVDADGLAIQTVNVDRVRVIVHRVTDRALAFREITSGFNAASGEWRWAYGEEVPGDAGVEVWRGAMDTPGPVNAQVTTVFPLAEAIGRLQPGAYYVEVDDYEAVSGNGGRNNHARARRWLIVTDLAFTAWRGADGMEVTVRSLQNARPAQGVDVRLIARSNEVLATQTTGLDGKARFSRALMSGADGNAPRMLAAYGADGDFALLDLTRNPVDLSSHPVSGRDRPAAADAYLYLDRGVYRPGETVQASALIRDAAARAVEDRAGALIVYQPNGLELTRHRFDGARNAGGLSHGFELPRSAARGQWRLSLTLDGAGEVGSARFAVEDFVPQRVELSLSADTDTPLLAGQSRMVDARVRFLYGAPGAGLPVEGSARVEPDPNPFPDWEGYRFGRHDERFSESFMDLPRTMADGRGEASVPVSADGRGEDSSLPLRVRAVIRVQEPGGRAVADDVRIPYRPLERYAGLKPEFDGTIDRNAPARFSLVAVDVEGAPVRADLQWRLVRRDYSYDWYRTDGGQWRWRRSERVVPIESGQARLDGAEPAAISTGALSWGDYALIVSDGERDVASSGFWVGYGGRARPGEEAPDTVRVAGPDRAPQTGGNATITIRAPYAGRAEVVVANDRILASRQIEVSEAGAELTLPVTREWGSGAYVMVSVYTGRDAVNQPRPRRAVGVAFVPVNVDGRRFDVTLGAPERVHPERPLVVDVRAGDGPSGERAWVTLSAVDEGILLLTNFTSPDPEAWFYGKPALGVDLLDDYGRLLDPNQGAAAAVRSGGDQIGAAGLSVVPTRTVALFSGPVQLDRTGRASIPLDIPEFNGELRLMAAVWSQTGLGSASRAVTVREDAPSELILPRFLAPGDTAQATVTIDNIDLPEGAFTARVSAEGPLSAPGEAVSLDLAPGQREDRRVALTGEAVGVGALRLSVDGPEAFATVRNYPIEVRSPWLPETRISRQILSPGERWSPPRDALAHYLDGSGSLQVTASAFPIDPGPLYRDLAAYPFACTEQSLSRAWPLLYAAQLAALARDDAPGGAAADVRRTIEQLLSRQSADGAFGLWRMGDGLATPWLGAYATDFLTRAAEAGYSVPRASVERALAQLQPVARGELWRASGYNSSVPEARWSRDTRERLEDRSSAYALYVLARNGQPDRSRLRYMHDERIRRIESPLARAHIGAGLAAIGDQARAASAFEAAMEALGYRNEGDWYQSPRRDMAGVLALAAEAGQGAVVERLSGPLGTNVPEPSRLTTQEKAFLIMAARALAGEGTQVSVSYDGVAEDPAAVSYDAAALAEAGTFENTGRNPVFLTAMARGAPASAPPASSSQLDLEKQVFTVFGDAADLSAVSQGDRLVVLIELSPVRQALASYAIADLLPAGFEIEGLLEPSDGAPDGPYAFLGDLSYAQVTEARDDRFVAAIESRRGRTERFAYLVRAVTPGDFALPGAVAEDMYRPDVTARTGSSRLVIGE